MFDPKPTKYPYPKDTSSHYLVVKKNDGTVFDCNYPYVDTSKPFLRKQKGTRVLLRLIVFPMARLLLGLKIEGRDILKKNKDILDKGVVSVSNHIHLWDYISIMKAVRPRKTNVLVWAPNIRGENGKLMRAVGGIPIPEDDLRATASYFKAVSNLIDNGGWLQIYPEGSMWEYYAPIRPFKHGAAYFACKLNKPLVPMAFSYRKPGFIRGKIFHQPGKITLKIGDPLYRNEDLSGSEQELDLLTRAHDSICLLAGIAPSENIYPPIYDHSERVDYYTSSYGKKKK